MHHSNLFFFLFSLVLFVNSCSSPAIEDLLGPEIEIKQPEHLQVFDNGETVTLDIAIADNDLLHEWSVFITNLSTSDQEFLVYDHEHAASLQFNDLFLPSVSSQTVYEISAYAVDHEGNANTVTSRITVNP